MIIGMASADFLRADRSSTGQHAWGGSGWARLGQYIPHFEAAGHSVVAGTLWNNDGALSIENEHGEHTFPDIILSQRLMHDNLDVAYKVAEACGQIVVCDVDDWYWGLSPENGAFKASHPKHNAYENIAFYKKSLQASHHLTVSTPYLADKVSGWCDSITVLPNYVDVSRFTPVTQRPGGAANIGWAGSTLHRSGDLEILRGILGPVAYRQGFGLVHGGDSGPPTFAMKIGVDEHRVIKIPRCGSEDYPSLLKFDVGVIPLRDIPFNHAKSDIKGLEYAAAGIPFVASPLPSYTALFKEWGKECFYTARKPSEWVKRLEDITSSVVKRSDMSAACLEAVKTRDIAIGAKEYLSYLESLT